MLKRVTGIEDVKIKLIVLWLLSAAATSGLMMVLFMMPFHNQQIMAGNFEGMPITEGTLLVLAIFWWIPLVMALLSLTQIDSVNRWARAH